MLVDVLKSIHTADDIGKLFSSLGYSEDDLPYSHGARTVARWRGFKVVAADSHDARSGVRALARQVATTSERALAAVVTPARELAITAPRIGQTGITRFLVVDLDNPSRFALQQLERLRPSRSATALAHALSVVDVLSSEAVGNRFFVEFKKHLERMAASIGDRSSADDRRMVALLCLSRILFLYFVQAKGWLDGRSDYLKNHLDVSLERRRNFHRCVLNPLFFGTLNQPPERRSKQVRLGNIPYLNGGLFEPHPAEHRIGPTNFPNRMWRDAFDEVFERFRFTVREDDEVDAIAPDMLGRVFERLMNAGERHHTGTFYTPESVVRQIVTATIESALNNALPRKVVQRLVAGKPIDENHTSSARLALERLRVLDPAVGSGAFLLGALDVLSQFRSSLESDRRPETLLRLRKEILRENLTGIDLNPVAVRLAELRLWLAVIADDPTTGIDNVTPLPNLDGVVRQGDTLLDPIGAARSFNPSAPLPSGEAVESIRRARHALFDARGQNHRLGAKRLREWEMNLARRLLESAIEVAELAVTDLTASAQSRDLFGNKIGLTVTQRERLRALLSNRCELHTVRKRLEDGVLPFFAFEVHAPDILATGGFDAVVGNPPWVRAEHLSPRMRNALRDRFQWWRTTGKRGFTHLPDLSVAFLERCLELARNGGAVGLLLPSKVTTAGYGEEARRAMVRETSIEYVHRVPNREAARFGATTYPLALVTRKARATRNHKVRLGFQANDAVHQTSLDMPGPWLLLSSDTRGAIDELCAAGTPLREISPPMLGVKTGADRLYIGRVVTDLDGISIVAFPDGEALIESEMLRPVLRGRDVRRFRTRPPGVIVWCQDDRGEPLSQLPPNTARYFKQHTRALRARSDYRRGPVWTVFRTGGVAKGHRVVWPDIARRPRSVVLEEAGTPTAIALNTCYVAATADRETALATAAVLNSTWAAAFFAASADEARGGYRRINARVSGLIPIPESGAGRIRLAELSKRAHKNDRPSDEDLDEAVADTFGLSMRTQGILRTLADTAR